MPNTTELEREILHAHPHEQELVHHAPGHTGVPTAMAVALGTALIAALVILVAIAVLAAS